MCFKFSIHTRTIYSSFKKPLILQFKSLICKKTSRPLFIANKKSSQSPFRVEKKKLSVKMTTTVKIGIIGGTGLDQDPDIIEGRKEGIISTPYGETEISGS